MYNSRAPVSWLFLVLKAPERTGINRRVNFTGSRMGGAGYRDGMSPGLRVVFRETGPVTSAVKSGWNLSLAEARPSGLPCRWTPDDGFRADTSGFYGSYFPGIKKTGERGGHPSNPASRRPMHAMDFLALGDATPSEANESGRAIVIDRTSQFPFRFSRLSRCHSAPDSPEDSTHVNVPDKGRREEYH